MGTENINPWPMLAIYQYKLRVALRQNIIIIADIKGDFFH